MNCGYLFLLVLIVVEFRDINIRILVLTIKPLLKILFNMV